MRARDLGIPFTGLTGQFNSITDVKGVEVGFTTIIKGDGPLVVGKGPVRTGVTMILPRGKAGLFENNPCYASWYSFNGNGEMTGTTWVDESGMLFGPIAITNTHSVGAVHDAIIKYHVTKGIKINWLLPVVAETYDGFLNDTSGFHVKEEHVFQAIENASTGLVEEGNVGGGTGMICHAFKGGTGTSSRIVVINDKKYTIGILVQANYGDREYFTIRGLSLGDKLDVPKPKRGELSNEIKKDGSIIVIVATDAPLVPYQLKKLTKRVPLGVGRVGGFGSNSSGDIFLAFSTANSLIQSEEQTIYDVQSLKNDLLNQFYIATIEATEEAILNSLTSAKTMIGINGNTAYQLPINQIKKIFSNLN